LNSSSLAKRREHETEVARERAVLNACSYMTVGIDIDKFGRVEATRRLVKGEGKKWFGWLFGGF
jgi:hypothetical protein